MRLLVKKKIHIKDPNRNPGRKNEITKIRNI